MPSQRWLLLAALLALPALAQAATPAFDASCRSAAAAPCGRIYPFLTIETEESGVVYNLSTGQELKLDAIVTYRFDVDQDGYAEPEPTAPIKVVFEFPRKPDWAQIKVEPETFAVPVEDPSHIVADPADPTQPQLEWRFSVPITITAKVTGQAVLRDGFSYHKLLVFAKSTESGLYMPGYGIKEVRVAPEGAIHESDLAGSLDVFEAVPLPPVAMSPVEARFGGTIVTLTPPAETALWQPMTFGLRVDPPPTGRMVAALHDEAGALVFSTPPLPAAAELAFTATLVRPGAHTATLTLLPASGGATPPMTFALPFTTGELGAEGYAYPKAYLVTVRESFQVPAGNRDDPFAQFERDVPFFAFDTAQSASAAVTLLTEGTDGLVPGTGNLQFSIVDPDGKPLLQSSVDPTAPLRSIRVGSLPMDGWYTLRLRGAGAPEAARYEARVDVAYPKAPQERNRADGASDSTGGTLGRAGVNLTLPVETLAVFAPSDLTLVHDAAGVTAYQLTVADANGTPVYASGLRLGPATFSAPAPGRYRAFAYAEPGSIGTPFSPLVRAFAFDVGSGATTIVSKFALDDGFEVPPATAQETFLGFHAVPVHDGAGDLQTTGGEGGRAALTDAEGAPVDAPTPGSVYVLRAYGTNAGAQPMTVPVTAEQSYATPLALAAPDAPADPPASAPVPWLAVGIVLVVLGLAGVAFAARRK